MSKHKHNETPETDSDALAAALAAIVHRLETDAEYRAESDKKFAEYMTGRAEHPNTYKGDK